MGIQTSAPPVPAATSPHKGLPAPDLCSLTPRVTVRTNLGSSPSFFRAPQLRSGRSLPAAGRGRGWLCHQNPLTLKFRLQLCALPPPPLVFRNAFIFSCSENFPETFQVLLGNSVAPWGASWHCLQLSLNYRDNFNFTIIRNINCSSSLRN